MFKDNKYTKWYLAIIDGSSQRPKKRAKGFELHHKIPESLGGSRADDNMFALTYREHFICHRLLLKMLIGSDRNKMVFAFRMMCNTSKVRVPAHVYEYSKIELSKIPSPNKGKPIHPNTQRALLASRVGKSLTIEHRTALSKVHTGRIISDEWRNNMAKAAKESSAHKAHLHKIQQAKIGSHLTEEHKQKLSQKLKGRKISYELSEKQKAPKEKITCPHCDMTGGKPVMKRYHFDKCKKLTSSIARDER